MDICKAKSVPLGLQVSTLDGFGLEVIKVKEASPVVEWNRMSARTFPEDVLRPGDIITNFFNDTSLPNGMETVLLIVVRRRS